MIGLRPSVEDAGLVDGLRQLQEQLAGRLEQATRTVADDVQEQLQAAAPVSDPVPGGRAPGGLRRSIRYDLSGASASFLASQVAEFVIGGTSPHTIVPRTASVLRFYWRKAGGFVSFMRVQHPGSRPNDFRQPAVEQSVAAAEQELAAVFDWVGRVVA